MNPTEKFNEFLRQIDHLPPAVQMEEILRFFTANIATMKPETVTTLRDLFAAKKTPETNRLAEVLEGHLALRDLDS